MSESVYQRNIYDTKYNLRHASKRDRNAIDVLDSIADNSDDADDYYIARTTSYALRLGLSDLYCKENRLSLRKQLETSERGTAAFDFFEKYLRRSKPLKIIHWTSFRDMGDASSSFLVDGSLQKSFGPLIDSMPAAALDKVVTVQAKPLQDGDFSHCKLCSDNEESNSEENHEPPSEAETVRHNLHVVDTNLTLSPVMPGDDQDLFLGQEDQVTTHRNLRDVLMNDPDPSLKMCIAQESIFSKQTGYIRSLAKVSNDGQISIKSNGSVNPAPLAILLPWVRLPSYLLPTDGRIDIQEINLWACREKCRTNTHYDGNHNLLMVLSGAKTVELSPPGAFRGSPVHSSHANHPFLLRCKETGGQLINEKFSEDTGFRPNKTMDNIVVSVKAGEAIFIPEGWWHRVESSDGCVAINVWFDHKSSSVATISHQHNRHMLPYQAREVIRRYIDDNIEEMSKKRAQSAFESLLSRYGASLRNYFRFEHNPGKATMQFLEAVSYGRIVPKKRTNEEIHEGLQMIEHHANQLLAISDEIDYDASPVQPLRQLVLHEAAASLGEMISFFITMLDPSDNRDRIAMMELFNRFPAVETPQKREIFTTVIKGIVQDACYILSVAWEKHQPAEQAQASFNSVFGRCVGDEGRRYFLAQVDDFCNENARRLILGDLMLLNPREGEYIYAHS